MRIIIAVVLIAAATCGPTRKFVQPALQWEDVDADAKTWVAWLDSLGGGGCERVIGQPKFSRNPGSD